MTAGTASPELPDFNAMVQRALRAARREERELIANLVLRVPHSKEGDKYYFEKHNHAVAIAAAIRALADEEMT